MFIPAATGLRSKPSPLAIQRWARRRLRSPATFLARTSQDDGQGAGISVSSNGNSDGIVWALDNTGFNSNPAVLYAYDATNLNTVLWTSSEAAAKVGTLARTR